LRSQTISWWSVCPAEGYVPRAERFTTSRRRLAVYREQTAPLIEYYSNRSILIKIDASEPIEEIHRKLLGILDEKGN